MNSNRKANARSTSALSIRSREADLDRAKAAWCFGVAAGLATVALAREYGIALATVITLALTVLLGAVAAWASIRAGKNERRQRAAREAFLARKQNREGRR